MAGLQRVLCKLYSRDSRYSEYASVTQGSVENSPSCMFDRVLSITQVLSMLGLEYTRAANMQRLHMAMYKLHFKDSQYSECLEF